MIITRLNGDPIGVEEVNRLRTMAPSWADGDVNAVMENCKCELPFRTSDNKQHCIEGFNWIDIANKIQVILDA
jgi:hypothetical protein